MSVGMISLVVWLLLVFLSVTEGIERGWLDKLTTLNAPLRINPTPAYYNSYYYQIDSISDASGYTPKSIGEKFLTAHSDPYSPETDVEIPPYWQAPDCTEDGSLKDPVKIAYKILNSLGLVFQDYEVTGAMMRLQLIRPQSHLITEHGDFTQSSLTQVSYIATFTDKNPNVHSLISKPTVQDLNHLLYLANQHTLSLTSLLEQVRIKRLKTSLSYWRLPSELLPEKKAIKAVPYLQQGRLSHFILSKKEGEPLLLEDDHFLFKGSKYPLSTPLFVTEPLHFVVHEIKTEGAKELKEISLNVESSLYGIPLKGTIPWDGLEIAEGELLDANLIAPFSNTQVFLAKSFQDNGVRIGDRGHLTYTMPTASSVQEQRLPIYVAGFYDPGIMAVGNKCILAPASVVHAINLANSSYHLDKTQANGIQVWFPNINDADKIKNEIIAAFKKAKIDSYWKVSSYRDYDFAKDLLQQFQSDKYLFTLIGIIILTVACCNIISLLVLLVNDKKKEIGILQAMGASTRSIAAIFGCCGILLGVVSSLIGTAAAFFTLKNIDSLVQFLSVLQGHDAFNAVFYGSSLPSDLSSHALLFILIATPILSLLAGLVPAIKACRLHVSTILRSE